MHITWTFLFFFFFFPPIKTSHGSDLKAWGDEARKTLKNDESRIRGKKTCFASDLWRPPISNIYSKLDIGEI